MLEKTLKILSPDYILAFGVSYLILLAGWRLYLSPLAKFPGPKLAAVTRLYEAYFDVYKDGQFFKQMEKLHQIYGPILRISPHELHVKDPDWVDELYTSSTARRRDKYQWHTAEGTQATSSSTVSHDLHRARRSAIAACFSKTSMKTLEPILQDNIHELVRCFDGYAVSGKPVVLGTIFAKLTIDLVLQMWLGCEIGEVERWKCLPDAHDAIPPPLTFSHRAAIKKMPIGLILDLQKKSAQSTKEALARPRGESWIEKKIQWKPIIRILQDSSLAAEQRSDDRIADEAFSFVMASLESTAQTLSVCIYHLLRNPDRLDKLRDELDAVPLDQGDLPFAAVEKLPYLRAVMDETLRINASVTGRLPRIATDEDLTYGKSVIPRGTPVSMDHHFTHLSDAYFYNAGEFIPERWLDPATRQKSYKYLRPFGKGSRMCIGRYVAECEMLMTIAAIVRNFKLELVDTTDVDVTIQRDYLAGAAHWDSTGVKIRVLGRRAENKLHT